MCVQLEKEFDYYLANQTKLVDQFGGRVLVIKDQSVIGDYESEIEALMASADHHDLGSFLIQRCEPGDGSYVQTYHSRVILA